jgi:hypothetical protein
MVLRAENRCTGGASSATIMRRDGQNGNIGYKGDSPEASLSGTVSSVLCTECSVGFRIESAELKKYLDHPTERPSWLDDVLAICADGGTATVRQEGVQGSPSAR